MLIHTCGLKSSAQPCHSTAVFQGSRGDPDHTRTVQMLRQHLLHSSPQLQTIVWVSFRLWSIDYLGLFDSPTTDLFHQSSTFSSSRVCGQSRPACGTSHWCHNPLRRGRTYRLGQNLTSPQYNLWKPVEHIPALAVLNGDLFYFPQDVKLINQGNRYSQQSYY